jgi:hypothetical protein
MQSKSGPRRAALVLRYVWGNAASRRIENCFAAPGSSAITGAGCVGPTDRHMSAFFVTRGRPAPVTGYCAHTGKMMRLQWIAANELSRKLIE